jgi:ABC-type branched-subunit amino acid transport system ATPase component
VSAPALTLGARGVYAGYGEVDVLHDVSITVRPRSVVSVIGANGAGKSTLLKAMYGLVPVRAGSVVVDRGGDRRTVTGAKPHRLTALGMNYVPQLANVFPNMSVVENLEVGGILDRSAAGERIERLLPFFEDLAARSRQRAGTLSGGQRQMLALARALMTEPSLLLLDEPSAGLSPSAIDRLFAKLREINDQGVAILLVEQNARRSLAFSDHGYVLETGRNRTEGSGRDLLADASLVDLYLGGRRRQVSDRT